MHWWSKRHINSDDHNRWDSLRRFRRLLLYFWQSLWSGSGRPSPPHLSCIQSERRFHQTYIEWLSWEAADYIGTPTPHTGQRRHTFATKYFTQELTISGENASEESVERIEATHRFSSYHHKNPFLKNKWRRIRRRTLALSWPSSAARDP